MRVALTILPLAMLASPALAQSPSPATTVAPPAARIAIPPELTDPRVTDRLVDMMQVMSKAFLDLPVGQIEAAVQGRQPSRADRRRTVGSETRMSERQIKQQLDQARPVMQAGMRAMANALPSMMASMSQMADEMQRATANLPQPGYPKR